MASSAASIPDSHPGPFKRFIQSIFGFRKTTLTLLLVLTFIASVCTTIYYEKLALAVPEPQPEILKSAWLDLQIIASRPHPYTSHDNDATHDYILKRTQALAKQRPGIIAVSDDYDATHTMINQRDVFDPANTDNRIIYFESGNVLVKIQGKEPSLEGVLVSAHYDSVPASHGATDNGMGVASMLGILEHYASNKTAQPERTIVLNFNDDEEFGLLGAEMFFKHPWSRSVKTFINLDGTGAGGRAVLFRTTDVGMLDYYRGVERPFANSIFQQGFRSGYIHSETDYHVYSANGMRGLDIAFYKPRSLYHTIRDSVTETSKGSLWHMEKNTLDIVTAMTSTAAPINDDLTAGVYFDFLGKWFFAFSLRPLVIINIILVVAVPTVIIGLLIAVYRKQTWFINGKGWLRLPSSLAGSAFVTYLASKYFYLNDPMLISGDYISPLLALGSLNLLCNYTVLNFFAWAAPVHDQKLICLLELTIAFWILSIGSIVLERKYNNVATYSVTVLFILFAAATIFGLLGLSMRPRPLPYERTVAETNPAYGSTTSASSKKSTSPQAPDTGSAPAENATETTPLQSSVSGSPAAVEPSDPLSEAAETPVVASENHPLLKNDKHSLLKHASPEPIPEHESPYEPPEAPQAPGTPLIADDPAANPGSAASISGSTSPSKKSKPKKEHFKFFKKISKKGQEVSAEITDAEHRRKYEKQLKEAALKSFQYDWSLQFLTIVPLSVFIIFALGDLILQAIHQIGQESIKLGLAVTRFTVIFAVSLSIPILPFAHKLSAAIVMFFAVVFVISSLVSYFEPPFSHYAPLKIRFLESIDLGNMTKYNNETSLNAAPKSVVNLYGRSGYIKPMLSDIPSLEAELGSTVECDVNAELGTETCHYNAWRPYLVDGTEEENKLDQYLNLEVLTNNNKGKPSGKYDPLSAVFNINLQQGRQCELKFNTSEYRSDDTSGSKNMSPVKLITVYNPNIKKGKKGKEDPGLGDPIRANIPPGYSTDDDGNHYFKTMKGIDTVQVHKLNFTQPNFKIGIQWMPFSLDDDEDPETSKRHLGVSVKCFWGEYDTEVLVGDVKRRMLPAYDELLEYTPNDVVLTNMAPGLLEMTSYLEL